MFLIGAPRSGTSLLYKCLALHPGFSYISNYNERLPRWESRARCSTGSRRASRPPAGRSGSGVRTATPTSTTDAGRWPTSCCPMPTEGESLFARCGLPGGRAARRPADARRGRPRCGPDVRPGAPLRRRPAPAVQAHRQQPPPPAAGRGVPRRHLRPAHPGRPGRRQLAAQGQLVARASGCSGTARRPTSGRPTAATRGSWRRGTGWRRSTPSSPGSTAVPAGQLVSLAYEDFVARSGRPPGRHRGPVRPGHRTAPGWPSCAASRTPTTRSRGGTELDPAALATVEQVQRDTLRRYGYA